MASEKDALTANIDPDVKERVKTIRDERGHDSLRQTGEYLINAGMREVQGPMPGRAREMALDGAYHLTLVAVTVIVIGFGTPILSAPRATAIALVMETVAVAPLAAVETLRAMSGQSELSEVVRR